MKKWLTTIGGVFLFLVCLLAWLVAAMDYGDSVATGTNAFMRNGQSSLLTLKLINLSSDTMAWKRRTAS